MIGVGDMRSTFLMEIKKIIMLSSAAVAMLVLSACSAGGGAGDDNGGVSSTPTIQLKGGSSISAEGREGGKIKIIARGYIDVSILKSGVADTTFSLPTFPQEENLGGNGKTISIDTNISAVESGSEPVTIGQLYLVNGSSRLCVAVDSGDTCDHNDTNKVTGLKIDDGVVVVVGLNRDSNNEDGDANQSTGQDGTRLELEGDLIINGVLKTATLTTAGGTTDNRHGAVAIDRDKGSLSIRILNNGSLMIGKNGKIDTSGDDATVINERGGDGGAIDLGLTHALVKVDGVIDTSGGNGLGTAIGGNGAHIEIGTDGVVVCTGTVNSSGGNGAAGGNAYHIDISSFASSYYTGSLLAMGGNGITQNGGNGGEILVASRAASIYNSGTIKNSGGNGALSGGSAAHINFIIEEDHNFVDISGEVLNSGDIYSNGGVGISGDGGSGGDIEIYIIEEKFGNIRSSGNIYLNGGKGGNRGGDAGDLEITKEFDDSPTYTGDIQISGNIELNGGDAGTGRGGHGGRILSVIDIRDLSRVKPTDCKIQFLGYKSIDFSGGDGNLSGGNGGYIDIILDSNNDQPVGSIINEAAIIAKGGYSENRDGGNGGEVIFEPTEASTIDGSKTINRGDIDISGGMGMLSGGDAGYLMLLGFDGLENSGKITAVGGGAEGNLSTAGQGGEMEIYSGGDILNSTDIIASGGNGTGDNIRGGDANELIMQAAGTITNSGDFMFNGGLSTGTAQNSTGGYVEIFSNIEYTNNTADTISVAKGSGGSGADGEVGELYIDSVDVTPNSGVLTK